METLLDSKCYNEIPLMNNPTKNIPTVFIIYGATGDLMAKKIVPALFHLYKKGKFPHLFKIIGVSRRNLTEESFIDYIHDLLIKHSKEKMTNEQIQKFLTYFLYHEGNFDDPLLYQSLASRMGIIDGEWSVCSNKLFYLAVPPQFYKNICQNLSDSGLTAPCGPDEGWTRVIVEKPFGHDFKTAEDLDLLLGKLFKEEQIYRIDHYLAKEMLQNILTFRFSNNLFEKSWSKKTIERINIRTWETIGAEGRGHFYDSVGALRDVGQNHLLQMLALITMEQPLSLEPEEIRKRRAEILKELVILSQDEIEKSSFRAQYRGYKSITGVEHDSQRETYFRIHAKINSIRWQGVEFMLEAGKKLPLKKEIEVIFKHPDPCLCPNGQPHFQNKIILSIEPKEGITIEFLSKKPGLEVLSTKRKLNFVNRKIHERLQYVEEYEKLLLDCISGNQTLFISTPEIQASWSFIDPILKAWEENSVPLHEYKAYTRQAITMADRMTQSV